MISSKGVAGRVIEVGATATMVRVEATEAVAELKAKPGADIGVLGSGELVRSLIRNDLVDEYLLLIHPLVLGSGRRMFPDGVFAALRLVDSIPTTTGVVIATYQPAEPTAGKAT